MVFVSWEVCFYVLYSVSSDLFVLFCKDWVFVVEIHSTTQLQRVTQVWVFYAGFLYEVWKCQESCIASPYVIFGG